MRRAKLGHDSSTKPLSSAAVGTPLAEGKECREFGGRNYVLEHGIRADFSLIKGRVADTHGNIL